MIRFLPIFLLTIGLILTFSSLARAETMQAASLVVLDDLVCVDTSETVQSDASAVEPGHKAYKCWKKRGQGLALLPCQPDPSLVPALISSRPAPEAFPFYEGRPVLSGTVDPLLERPPPRA